MTDNLFKDVQKLYHDIQFDSNIFSEQIVLFT